MVDGSRSSLLVDEDQPLLLTRQGRTHREAQLAELNRQRGLIAEQIRQCREPGEPGENGELVDAKQAQALLECPLGQELLGRVAGDRVEIDTPGGRASHTILAIETQDDL